MRILDKIGGTVWYGRVGYLPTTFFLPDDRPKPKEKREVVVVWAEEKDECHVVTRRA